MPDESGMNKAAEGVTPFQRRARYIANENGFAFTLPPVPPRQFLVERDRAFDPAGPTGMIALDCADALGTAYPATTPTLLCRYLKIRASEQLHTAFVAGGEVCYVMSGSGESRNRDDRIVWGQGDVFCFPGGAATVHLAGDVDCLLFCITNEPLLSLCGLQAPAPGSAPFEATHWPNAEIERRFQAVYQRPITDTTTGHSIQFSTEALAPSTHTIASVNVSINTLMVGGDQRPHRHNGVAVTLALEGEGVSSMIDGRRVDWSTGAAQITPATKLHSHHNRGPRRMRSLVIQDEALHDYTRTPGFSFD